MKESKAIYVTKRDIKQELNRDNKFYANNIIRDRECSPVSTRYEQKTCEVGCQYDSKRDNLICTCKNLATLKKRQEVRYFGLPNQIYAYQGSKSYTEIGVGSVKALQRKKVKKIYLPETDDRGVGSSDLSSFVLRRYRQRRGNSYYENKRTSSKCVGGVIENKTGCVMSEKLSPIVHTISGSTSPRQSRQNRNIEIGSNTVVKNLTNTTTQVEETNQKDIGTKPEKKIEEIIQPILLIQEEPKDMKNKKEEPQKQMERKDIPPIKVYSSDSLEQHVHNLENPSDDKLSRFSVDTEDPMENKLEREYRRIFSAKSKSKDSKSTSERPVPDFKSTSTTLKRRFEALRRGLAKKEDSKKNSVVVSKVPSQVSAPSRKDVSINSDPPSLEGRSFSNTKTYSPFSPSCSRDKSVYHPRTSHYRRSVTGGKRERGSEQWSSRPDDDSECQGVKGMFKLWGKKFNLEEDHYKRQCTPRPSYNSSKKTTATAKKMEASKVEIKIDMQQRDEADKKEGRKFFFFKKKNKEKNYKPKKGVTAGRCEVRDGLVIKIGGNAFVRDETADKLEESEEPPPEAEGYEELARRAWLKKFLTSAIESRNSVQVRWNNKTYARSSSTVFELMDTVYRDTGVVFRSKSQVTTKPSYKSYTKQHVNFVQQNIEAWMIPKTLPDKPKLLPVKMKCKSDEERKDNIEVRISDQKWFIDKSKAFSHKIEVVLHSKNFSKLNKAESSDYLRIDIPKGFFIDSSSDDTNKNPNNQSSDEEVFKIVEYETASDLKKQNARNFDTGDYKQNNIKVTVSVKESKDGVLKIMEPKKPPLNRDVVIQGSNVYIPKRCDVVGVGIITRREMKDIRKPILKIADDYSDNESEHNSFKPQQKKCEFAESYLQEYYRHWTPLGMDLYSWCVSDSHLRCCSENSKTSFNNQGDGTKSCPNIFDDFQASTMVSSCGASSCSQCHNLNDDSDKPPEKCSWFGKFLKKPKELSIIKKEVIQRRILPKDSVEVFKRRKIYAASLKSKWVGPCPDFDQPYSVPSNESKSAQNTLTECPKLKKSCCKTIEQRPRRGPCQKHVSLPDCDTMNEMLAKQLADVVPEGILAFKGGTNCEACKRKAPCPKHAKVNPNPSCEIPRQPCRDSCENSNKPACEDSTVPCSDKPPTCPGAKSPSCPPTPTCKKPPSCPATPPCKKPPSCPPKPCSKPPSCPPTPPPCPRKPPSCPRTPPSRPRTPPSCPPTPPSCPPTPPSCPPTPPSCPRTPPSCPSTPPSCPPSPPTCRRQKSPPPCRSPPPHCPPSPPKCKKPPQPSCPPTPPPSCKIKLTRPASPSPCKKPPPCPPSPPPCRKLPPSPPPPCPPSPPPCRKTPSCPKTPPPCKKHPSRPSTPPPCKKHPSCPSTPPPCKKHPSCPPTPPPCKKRPSCPSTPPPCRKPASSPPSSPPCKKLPSCPPSPPPCRKHPASSPPPCPSSPPSCKKHPSCPSTPPSCKKHASSSSTPPPCRKPPSCPPSPPPCKKPPSSPPCPPPHKKSCPHDPPCPASPPCPPSPPASKKPPTCPPSPSSCPSQPQSPPSCPHLHLVSCPSSPPQCPSPPCPYSPTPCIYAPPPCPYSPPPCPYAPPPCPYSPPPCPHTPKCPHTPPCHPPPLPPLCTTSPTCSTPPCCANITCPLAPPSCPASCPSCGTVNSDKCPPQTSPCKKGSGSVSRKFSPFFKRKTIICSGSPPSKPAPCKSAFCKPSSKPSPCQSTQTCVPSPCKKFSSTSCSYGSLHPTPDAPFFYSPIHPCPPEPEKPKKVALPCDSSPCNTRHPKYKPPPFNCKDSIIVTKAPEPRSCDQCRRTDVQQQGDDFPWPTKNQISNQSSITSLYHATNGPPETLIYGECKKDCPMMPKLSCETIPSPKKECKDSCPNKQGSPRPPCIPDMQCPRPKPPSPPPEPPKPRTPEVVRCRSKSKLSGLYLKMKPVAKKKSTCSKDCLAWDSIQREDGCISLNSEEKITIRLKKETPSTSEIREGLNIKVQDEDGMTLFERKDYRLQHADCSIQRPSLLGEMYRASEVRRVTTSNSVQALVVDNDCLKGVTEVKSDASIANLIEIQFKLKVTQGEKTTEINIANDGDRDNEVEEKIERNEGISQMPQDVFVMKDVGERLPDHSDQKNDINIRIVIKNFKPKSRKKCVSVKHGDYSKEFSKKISAKFHTVSTGYSDELHDDNVFSVHRATVDLTSSIDKSKTYSNRSEEMMSEPLTELGRGILMGSSEPSICRCVITDMSEGKSEDTEAKSVSQKYSTTKDIQEILDETDTEKLTDHKYEYTEETDTEKQMKYDTETDTEKQAEPKYDTETDTEKRTEPKYDTFMSTDTDEAETLPEIKKSKSIEVIVKPHSKDEKKEMLKQVFEKAHETKTKNKTRMRKLRDMLKVILTSDSSDHEDTKPPTTELNKDATYATLKPNYFRKSDSMNNYYREETTVLTDGEINRQVVYPTIENSECSGSNHSDVLSSENESPPRGACMCSTVAARLKLASRIVEGGGCCCVPKPPTKKNEEVTCDLKKESDFFQYEYKTPDYVDAETQNSRYLTSKMNSTNLSAHRSLKTSATASINFNDYRSNSGIINVNDRHYKTRNTFSPRRNHVRECETRKINRNTMLSISDEDKIVLLSGHSTKFNSDSYSLQGKSNRKKIQDPKGLAIIHASDILQSYETKKAVLEIYTEKTVSDEGERLVAKLPKFVYDREHEIQTNYEAIATNTYKSVCKKNIVMMAINR